jgi:Immunoglobulin I-set domain
MFLQVQQPTVIATEGALAVLTVFVSGNPIPDVYWRKGKKDITNVGKFRIIEGGHLQVTVHFLRTTLGESILKV